MWIFIWIAVIGSAASVAGTLGLRLRALERQVDGLNRRVALLVHHFGLEDPGSGPDEEGLDRIRALVRAGRTIEAIKLHRTLTGSSLRDAKAAVESLDV
ncbi:hypothetical protein LG634_14720 [Streptomyces bambusae]|uniref:hypothetical protein n=1 Tax=Streptomyces bambusae TaxID=1550616 RepID=UPI001CFC4E4F|nr:hypothetical protein [Streptomyces bambusae]MCB5166085.1 hypothetical protein [Streptomyces bambusae]